MEVNLCGRDGWTCTAACTAKIYFCLSRPELHLPSQLLRHIPKARDCGTPPMCRADSPGFLTLSIFDQQSVCPVCYLFVEERQNAHGAEAEENVQQIRSGVHEIRSPILVA